MGCGEGPSSKEGENADVGAVIVVDDDDDDDDDDDFSENAPASVVLGSSPTKGTPILAAISATAPNADRSLPPSSIAPAPRRWGLTMRSAPHLPRSDSSSPGAPFALRGTHVAQWHVASIASASSGPFGRTRAMRSPRPKPRERRDGPYSSNTKERTRSWVRGDRPSMDARADRDGRRRRAVVVDPPPPPWEEEEEEEGMAEQKVGNDGRMARATSLPTMRPLGCSR